MKPNEPKKPREILKPLPKLVGDFFSTSIVADGTPIPVTFSSGDIKVGEYIEDYGQLLKHMVESLKMETINIVEEARALPKGNKREQIELAARSCGQCAEELDRLYKTLAKIVKDEPIHLADRKFLIRAVGLEKRKPGDLPVLPVFTVAKNIQKRALNSCQRIKDIMDDPAKKEEFAEMLYKADGKIMKLMGDVTDPKMMTEQHVRQQVGIMERGLPPIIEAIPKIEAFIRDELVQKRLMVGISGPR